MISIKNLTKIYGDIIAVDDISFDVQDNEILGFLGPNGAGKSTTMNMITGYLPSTSGSVTVDGYDVAKNPLEAKKRIGYLPELPPLYPDMRVKEYLSFCAGIKSVPAGERKKQISDAMELFKITDVKDRVIKNLSKGYRQRVGFAQAILGNPKVLILDEPTVGLDPNQTLEVRKIIKMLKKDRTIIFSSHILQEVSAICERVVIIDKGVIKAVDTPLNLSKDISRSIIFAVTVEGAQNKATEVLRGINGVRRIVSSEQAGDNTYEFKLEVSDDKVRNEIFRVIGESELNIQEFRVDRSSLEDVFVSLTGGKDNKEQNDSQKKSKKN